MNICSKLSILGVAKFMKFIYVKRKNAKYVVGNKAGASKVTTVLAVVLIVLLFISLILVANYIYLIKRYESLRRDYLNLRKEYQNVQESLNEKEQELMEVDQKLEDIIAKLKRVEADYQKLKSEYARLESLYKSQSEKYEDESKLQRQLREVLYYRQFTIYDYKNDEYYMPYVLIPAWMYWNRRWNSSRRIPYFGLDPETLHDYFRDAVNSWKEDWPIQDLAAQLRGISGEDDEFYANLVLQVVHQLFYNVTDYTKYPIESLVEGSGDCDTLAVLLASLLEAGGLDAIILLGYVRGSAEEEFGGAHALVAVYLSEMPDDITRENYWSVSYDGKT